MQTPEKQNGCCIYMGYLQNMIILSTNGKYLYLISLSSNGRKVNMFDLTSLKWATYRRLLYLISIRVNSRSE